MAFSGIDTICQYLGIALSAARIFINSPLRYIQGTQRYISATKIHIISKLLG